MKIAVITPYFDEDEDLLRACHDSVIGQIHPVTHIMVADGHPQAWINASAAQHIVLPVSHRNYGDTPRAVASLAAIGQGFDGVAYLDADNWYQPNHIETVVEMHRATGAAICSTNRSIHRLDGSLLGYCEASEGEDFVDTNCLAVFGQALELLPQWALMPEWAHALGDRMMWHILRQSQLKRVHSQARTVCYRSSYGFHYRKLGEDPPPGSAPADYFNEAIRCWYQKGFPPFRNTGVIRPPD
ncbi:glycosyltransferase family 2 protein [Pelagibius sp.]|uniref:glycosyltransferase family 2 protein n=1 Tax=Pelagibius sp. TaxID=1931238 RepID=UPI003BB1483D